MEEGETDHFGAADHVRAVVEHVGEHVIDYVLINSNPASVAAIGPDLAVEPVIPEDLHRIGRDIKIVTRDVVSDRNPLRHDPANPLFNQSLRQLIHVGFKVAAQMGERYLTMLKQCEAAISRNVTGNLLDRHLMPLFGK